MLRAAAGAGSLKDARVELPEGDVVLRQMGLARDALYLNTMEGGVDRLEQVPIGLLGRLKKAEFLRLPFDNSITQLVTHPTVQGAILRLQGWIDAPRIMQVDAKSGDSHDTRLAPPGASDFSDGRGAPPLGGGTPPGHSPPQQNTRLTGDNRRCSRTAPTGRRRPRSIRAPRVARARGGSRTCAAAAGGDQHRSGRGPTMNTILDFIAVPNSWFAAAPNPARLAIVGHGAGAIPVGGALVRRPELFAAVVAEAPVMDMLRAELMPNGPANIPEFGSSATPDGAEQLRAISAYYQVKEAAAYPAVLLTAARNDARVEPWQPGKMAARLQAANAGGKPVLLRVDYDAGHGRATPRF